ncbi:hypothetical protein [Stutzerimonas decontaminans]|uniref:Uncharacterized protein n=1 Tax=Stutzerimonas stutzeri TaxID=316 RepID=A0A023WZS3_STUST|nr:hypothetical protein [Stutzerimonas decontaminans]AHY45265.1 hypothetical protein UIB01_22585 [Stutzerimonas decontaminans]
MNDDFTPRPTGSGANDTRLAAMARRKELMKIARGEPLGPNDTDRVIRLMEQQGMLASPAP